ncbi:uncharacterized protein A1O9_05174 [Exophiala aquamarina CBS 119918]|uniref:Cytochrome P450 oxidoreductase n=1 Tax=Exophiala aquamarina CBS 119918 TaxID=1182545 RepID=A0A072PBY7_9EURO|nr:uncharacterized protein A1O9_05174 [Exophiala aquamarina CBS 119918]KEF57257.1 hypothetical protein A1O9_05174 [Exophiala aquamarina CBS 119918]
MSGLPEFYYDAIKQGQYFRKIAYMHAKYGPVVRIGSDEIHVNDPKCIQDIYAGPGKVRDKYNFYTQQFGIPEASLTTPSHGLHRVRRAAIAPFFSKRSVSSLEPVIVGLAEQLYLRLNSYAGTDQPVVLNDAFSCFATDVIMEYSFARSYGFLQNADFLPNLRNCLQGLMISVHYVKHFPWVLNIMDILPMLFYSLILFAQDIKIQVNELWTGQNTNFKTKDHPTIFHALLNANAPASEKHPDRLWQEGFLVIGAGTETTAWILTTTMYYLIANPCAYNKLKQELLTEFPNISATPTIAVVDRLPFLISTAEGLRLGVGVSSRLQRISPTHPIRVGDWTVPPGTPVGMSSILVHHNHQLFYKPYEFIPERWIENPKLDDYLLSFSKGSRQCAGITLAYTELRLVLATLIRRLDFTLFKTTVEDVALEHDLVTANAGLGSKGVRVLVK